jgi:hypothetical protein
MSANKKYTCSQIQEQIDKYYEKQIKLTADALFKDFEEYLEEPSVWKDFYLELIIPNTYGVAEYSPAILSELKKHFEEEVKVTLSKDLKKIKIQWG